MIAHRVVTLLRPVFRGDAARCGLSEGQPAPTMWGAGSAVARTEGVGYFLGGGDAVVGLAPVVVDGQPIGMARNELLGSLLGGDREDPVQRVVLQVVVLAGLDVEAALRSPEDGVGVALLVQFGVGAAGQYGGVADGVAIEVDLGDAVDTQQYHEEYCQRRARAVHDLALGVEAPDQTDQCQDQRRDDVDVLVALESHEVHRQDGDDDAGRTTEVYDGLTLFARVLVVVRVVRMYAHDVPTSSSSGGTYETIQYLLYFYKYSVSIKPTSSCGVTSAFTM